MKLKRIKIGPASYKVRTCKSPGENQNYGQIFNIHELRIEIDSATDPQRQRMALLHETIHAADAIYPMRLTEEQVTLLSSVMTQVLRENPALVKEICADK